MTRIPPDRRITAHVALFGLVLAACVHRPPATAPTAPSPTVPTTIGSPGYDAIPELRTVHADAASMAKARADSVRHPYTDADVRFMTGMISHHAQAIAMARLARPRGADPAVQRLADRIMNAQVDEIFIMQQWLADRGKPVPHPDLGGHPTGDEHAMHHDMSGMAGMGGMSDMDHMMMPGMLTPEQMRQLEAARGPDFDRLFLTGMIQHHKGAVQMVKELSDTYGSMQDELVFKFAGDVEVDQTTEIARMEKMLVTLSLISPQPRTPQ